jgi:hypothetical protein
MPPRTFVVATALLLALPACERAPGPTEPAGRPLFLLGETPTNSLVQVSATERYLELEVEVTRGIIEARAEDRFLLRTSAEFSEDGSVVGLIEPKTDGIADVTKDAELRTGSMVPVRVVLSISDALWEALLAADAGAGDVLDVSLVIELLLQDSAGGVRLLDRVTATGLVDPKTDG